MTRLDVSRPLSVARRASPLRLCSAGAWFWVLSWAAAPAPAHAEVSPGPPSDAVVEEPAAPLPGPDTEEAIERVRLLLSAYHALPPRSAFEEAVADPESTLWHIATHAEEFFAIRQRALVMLSAWPTDRLRAYYEFLLADDTTHEIVQHQVFSQLLATFGDRGLNTAARWLSSDDMQRRLTAVHALARSRSTYAAEMLEQRLEFEEDAFVRERIEAALRVR
jgi:hypothetical protein